MTKNWSTETPREWNSRLWGKQAKARGAAPGCSSFHKSCSALHCWTHQIVSRCDFRVQDVPSWDKDAARILRPWRQKHFFLFLSTGVTESCCAMWLQCDARGHLCVVARQRSLNGAKWSKQGCVSAALASTPHLQFHWNRVKQQQGPRHRVATHFPVCTCTTSITLSYTPTLPFPTWLFDGFFSSHNSTSTCVKELVQEKRRAEPSMRGNPWRMTGRSSKTLHLTWAGGVSRSGLNAPRFESSDIKNAQCWSSHPSPC